MDMSHLDPLRKELLTLGASEPPRPWRTIGRVAVGGLRSIGFDRNSELFLVVSSAGRGVIDGVSGSKVARDDSEYYEGELALEAEGIGPLTGSTLRVAGLFGGGLPTMTTDGWSVEAVPLRWPVTEILLLEPYASLYDSLQGRPSRFHKLRSESETVRGYGFSYSGRTLVLATSSDVTIYGRDGG
jgi:hypothetical protein